MHCNFIELWKRNTIPEKLTQLIFSDYSFIHLIHVRIIHTSSLLSKIILQTLLVVTNK